MDNFLVHCDTLFIQYVDDLLICCMSEDTCLADMLIILTHLANVGYKVNKAKLQVARPMVCYLGRQIAEKGMT